MQHDTPGDAPPAYSSPSESAIKSEDTKQSFDSPAPASAGVAALATTKNSEPSYDDLKSQLEAAKKTVAQLKADQGGLRQRNVGGGASSEKPAASKPAELVQAVRGTEGVPIQITAVLCFLSFLLAYIFF